MSAHVRVIPKTRAQLMALANPEMANQPEALPWILYDTQTYVDATTLRLTFFANTNADRTLSNMEAAGQLPDPQFFEVWYIGMDILRLPTAGGAAVAQVGALDDVELLLKGARSTFTLNLSNKVYGPFPCTFLHASGGATGLISTGIALQQQVQVAQNGIFDGGWFVGGSIVLPPKVGWNFGMEFQAAQDLTADALIRLWMAGVLHRRVL